MTRDLWNYPLAPEPIPGSVAPMRVALVSCGKAKLAYPAPARSLYTGSLFRAARKAVERAGYDAWWILSARYGLVHPDEILGPYEATLAGRTGDELHAWANKVDSRFRCSNYGAWSQAGGRLTVDIFAGRAYIDPLVEHTSWWATSWTINLPHHGLQIGERIAAFAAGLMTSDAA